MVKLDEKVNYDNSIYRYKGNTPDDNFNALNFIDKVNNGEIKLAEAKNDEMKFKSNLGEIKKGKNKSKEQKNALYNIEMLYKAKKRGY